MDNISLFMAKINMWEIFGYISIGFFLVIIFAKKLRDKILGWFSKSKSKSD